MYTILSEEIDIVKPIWVEETMVGLEDITMHNGDIKWYFKQNPRNDGKLLCSV